MAGATVFDRYALSKGYATLSVALNDAVHACNPVIEAESMMIAKEHIIETYGELRSFFGYGGSGGALAQQWMNNAYPGLYDGIIVTQSFPDAGSTTTEVEDCALMRDYFAINGTGWTPEQRAAAQGHLSLGVCNE